jgi:hypothetical protein
MKQIAVDKARKRLAKASACLERIEASRSFGEFESAWTDLLIALDDIHTTLEQGAKTNPQSRQWYGGKKNERRKDALLSYLHQARNADKHGIEPIASHKPGGVKISEGARPTFILKTAVKDGKASLELHPVEGPGMEIIPPSAELIPVRFDRFGDVFEPPTQHLGSILPDTSPLTIARLGFKYHEELVQAASQRVQPT